MNKAVYDLLRKISVLFLFCYFLFAAAMSHALPFTIVPKAGTSFPTTVNLGETKSAFYTVTNNTASQRNNNYVKYLPPNVIQVTSGGTFPNTCGASFNLAPASRPGSSCTLQLAVTGAVNSSDPNPHHHLFVCFPGGLTCAGTNFPLNVGTLVSIAVNPANAGIFIGRTLQYTAIGTYSNGKTIDVSNTSLWKSSNLAVATISATGLATGVGQGITTITASQQGITSNPATLNVTAIVLTAIAIVPASANAIAGDTVQYTATGTFNDGHTADLTASATWKSSNVSVATINSTGLATGVDTGSTTITAQVGGIISNAASLSITNPLISISVTPTTAAIPALGTQQYTATGTFAAGPPQNITNSVDWFSSNEGVATISSTGLATGASAGTTLISATSGGVTSNSATLTVSNPLVSIAITPTAATIATGSTQQYTAIGTFTVGDPQNITNSVSWNSSNTAVATISATGLATGVGVGTSNITASQAGITSNTAVLTVNSFLYVVNNGTSISYCDVDASGNLTGCLSNTATPTPQEIAIAPNGRFAYITNGTTISVCTIVAASGNLTNCFATGGGLTLTTGGQVAVHPNGNFVYTVNSTGAIVCSVNASTGVLSNCALTSATFANLAGITINPAGTFAYLSSTSNNIFYCGVNPTTGALFNCLLTTTGSTPFELTVNPAGTFLYFTNFGSNNVSTCPINPNGTVGACSFNVGFVGPRGITINEAGTIAYITNFAGGTVAQCPIIGVTGLFGVCTTNLGFTNPFGIAIN